MFIRCEVLMEGPGPSDVIVALRQADGRIEEVVVDQGSLRGETLNVSLIGRDRDGRVLIELPREATSGQGRIWLSESEVLEAAPAE